MRTLSRRARVLIAPLVVLVVIAGAPLAYSAFSATTANAGNSFGSAASFPTYPASVALDTPSLYHRSDEPSVTTSATDSSGNGRTGTYPASSAPPEVLYGFDTGSGTTATDSSGNGTPAR